MPSRRALRGNIGQRRVQALELDRVEPLAQHRLERILPSRLDVEPLPEAPRAGDAVVLEPLRAVLALPDLRLQRRERLRPRLDVREPVPGLLRGVARGALALLQLLHGIVQRIERGLLRRELGRFLPQLRVDLGDLARDRRAQRVELGLQTLAARRELRRSAPRRSRAGFR